MKHETWLVVFALVSTLNLTWAYELNAFMPAWDTLICGVMLGVNFVLLADKEK